MTEQGYKTARRVCIIVAVCCVVAFVVLFALLYNNDLVWSGGTELALKAVSAGVFVPPVIVVSLRYKMNEEKKEKRIEALEKELERLKRK